ncbi:Ty1/Copia family ribonuclease HI, partial [Enterobacter hormaechei]|uniref:Ty1/Copia family ribonuclease HI n=1 Tax=Enterobacter hormaechei TaxID=158836 RepID=UPI0023E462DB
MEHESICYDLCCFMDGCDDIVSSVFDACKEAIWLKRLCSDVGVDAEQITIWCDSQSAICLAKNPTFHARTKHIDVQFHFVRDMVEDGKVNLEKVDTVMNVANALTKPVGTEKFRW